MLVDYLERLGIFRVRSGVATHIEVLGNRELREHAPALGAERNAPLDYLVGPRAREVLPLELNLPATCLVKACDRIQGG